MKIFVKITAATIAGLLVIYLGFSLYISFKVNSMIKTSYDRYGQNNPSPQFVSNELYKCIDYRGDTPEDHVGSAEINKITFPITFFAFNKAYVTYRYTYERLSSEGIVLNGSTDIPVNISLELKDWKWVVTEKYEKP